MRSTLIVLALFSFVTSQTSSSASASSTGQLSDCASMCMNAASSMGSSSCSSMFTSCLSNQGCPDQTSTISSIISQRCGAATGGSSNAPAINVNSNSNSNGNSNSGPMTSMNSATGNDPNVPFGLPGSVLNNNNNNNGNSNSNNNNNNNDGFSNSNQPSNSNSNNNFNGNSMNSNTNNNNNGNSMNGNGNSNLNAPSSTPLANPFNNAINPFGLVQTAGVVNINNRPTATNAPSASVIGNGGWSSAMNTSVPTSNSPVLSAGIMVALIPLLLVL